MAKKGKFVFGALLGASLGVLFAPKKGSETRKELMEKLEELKDHAKDVDVELLRDEFIIKVDDLKYELENLDKEEVLTKAKKKSKDLEKKAKELVKLAKEKGQPKLEETAESVLQKTIVTADEVLKKIEKKGE